MQRRIFKYPLVGPHTSLRLPGETAQPLRVERQGGRLYLWALVEPDEPDHKIEITIYGTGHPIDEPLGQYINTVYDVTKDGEFVWHAFYKRV